VPADSTASEHDHRLIRVLAAVITDGARYLVCQRPAGKRHGGLWEFPGGKLEPGESLLDAADRELQEELGVRAIRAGAPLFASKDPGSAFLIEFVPVEIDGEPECLEHSDLRWATLEEMQDLQLAPSDRKFVSFLLHRP
jgi:8-oxo-dGTP diphosphatase